MKKTLYMLLATSLLCITTGALAADSSQSTAGTELRPMQKAMQARAGWLKDMNANLAAMKYVEVTRDAKALATQTDAAGKTLPNPVAKELTMKLTAYAMAVADAADKKDGAVAKLRLADVKATCDECHAKIRDKK